MLRSTCVSCRAITGGMTAPIDAVNGVYLFTIPCSGSFDVLSRFPRYSSSFRTPPVRASGLEQITPGTISSYQIKSTGLANPVNSPEDPPIHVFLTHRANSARGHLAALRLSPPCSRPPRWSKTLHSRGRTSRRRSRSSHPNSLGRQAHRRIHHLRR